MTQAAWGLYIIMDDDNKCVQIVAKDPGRPLVIDVTAQIAALCADKSECAQEPLDQTGRDL
jgi:hypothetical protein